jgi:mannose-6-phosphate isomerase-like protein (cupin superfamily)
MWPRHAAHRLIRDEVDLLGFFVSGRGDMWRKREGQEEIVSVEAGVCPAIVLRGKWEATVP